jgi:hypothetical protein
VTTSALGYLYTQVAAALTSDATAVHFGRREPGRQVGQGVGTCNRVVIDPSTGTEAGKFAPPKYPGRNPRPLASFVSSGTVYVWALDPSFPNDELANYEAALVLLGKTYAAIRNALHRKNVTSRAVHGWFEAGAVQWVGDKIERTRGTELSFALSVFEDVLDVAAGEATNVTGIEVTTLTGADGA